MWFNEKNIHIDKKDIICVKDIQGFVLPHAGTDHSGHILSHTLRFKPRNFFSKVLILYYPAYDSENVEEKGKKYYHEYLVPWKTMELVLKKYWNFTKKKSKTFIGVNVRNNDPIPKIDLSKTLIILSADFSHFLPMQEAIKLENCAAHAVMQRYYNVKCTKVVDDMKTFKFMYENVIPKEWMLQWVGRTRSEGKKGVGYLSFMIRKPPHPHQKKPNGMFVTAYDHAMQQRECLGEWFNNKHWNKTIEKNLIDKVLRLGRTTSRLTGGSNTHVPIDNYSITYLYKQPKYNKSCKTLKKRHRKRRTKKKTRNTEGGRGKKVEFIRGWHGIKHNAFYLPDVMLENTFNNGEWMNRNETVWPQGDKFNMIPTLKELDVKAGMNDANILDTKYDLYYSSVIHHKIT